MSEGRGVTEIDVSAVGLLRLHRAVQGEEAAMMERTARSVVSDRGTGSVEVEEAQRYLARYGYVTVVVDVARDANAEVGPELGLEQRIAALGVFAHR